MSPMRCRAGGSAIPCRWPMAAWWPATVPIPARRKRAAACPPCACASCCRRGAAPCCTRAPPRRHVAGFEAPERAVLREEQVQEATLRDWLTSHELALIVTRDQTSRDRADLQQPYNLQVPGGIKTVSKTAPQARVYDIAHFQLFQADAIRAYPGRPGRRSLAQPLHDGAAVAANPPNRAGPPGSVRIAADGSTAAFVPARRALTWQSTDPAGTPIVRERNWITFQAGE